MNFSTSGSTLNPTISLNPTSGAVATLVTVTGNGFDPISTVAITFGGSSVAAVTPTSNGGFTATFRVPLSSSIGDQTVKATQGFNSASKTFTVTSIVNPIIFLDPTSGPVGTSVDISGAGLDPDSPITIEFDGTPVDTSPSTVTSTPAGFFTATFNVPPSSIGDHTVKATEGSNSASKTFTVTSSAVPTIVLNPTSGSVGTSINITGVNFDPNSEVRIFFFGTVTDTLLSTVTTNNIGEFSANSTVPDELPGQYTVEANGGF